nr:cellulose synthase-like protein e6 [Quercus suber]
MDEEKGNEVGFIQFPQAFENLTKNDVYSSSLNVTMELEMPGFDGNGGPCYIGTGCFHRRETLSGKKYKKNYKADWERWSNRSVEESTSVLEETSKVLASCSYEENTQWGKETGLKYDCVVEDVLTGLTMQCRGWRSMYFNPERKGFLGVVPTTLLQSLVQHKRWSEGVFQIFASRNCPFVLGYKKIPLKLQLSYCIYLLWAPTCLATLYYATVPSLCLLRGISLFPQPWRMYLVWGHIQRTKEGDCRFGNFGLGAICITDSSMWSISFNQPSCLPRTFLQERHR